MFYFYLSHARGDEDDLVQRFFQDLSVEVRVNAGLARVENVGFLDSASIEVGGRWSSRLTDALSTCRTFVALCSPRYFTSENCGKEWAVFSRRVEETRHRSGKPPTQAGLLMPLMWLPMPPHRLPAVAKPLQYSSAALGETYDRLGVRQLMRLQRHKDDYNEFLLELARHILEAAQGWPITDRWPIEFDTVQSAFHSMASPSTAAPASLDATSVVRRAFAEAGKSLQPTNVPGLFTPGPVWISDVAAPTMDELRRFAQTATHGRLAYLVHTTELNHEAEVFLDRMRIRGYPVTPIALRALRAAVTDGSSQAFLMELERRSGTKDNLFDTKNALTDERFLFGRSALLNTIGGAIGRDEHVLVTGLRKVGKTSMLNVLRQHLVDHPVCMVDLQRFDRHHEDWPSALFHLMIDAFDRWGSINHLDWPFQPCWPGTTTELERELERRQAYLDRPVRLTVILDEIERVFPHSDEEDAARRWIRATGALRVLAQGDRRFVAVIGADLRPIANRENSLGRFGTNPLFSFFQEIPLTLLDYEALAEMVETIAEEMGLESVQRSFTERLFRLTGGHPSLARTIAGEAYRQRQVPSRLAAQDLEVGLSSLNDSDSVGYFLRNNLWQLMTSSERAVMAAMAGMRAPAVAPYERKQAELALAAQGLMESGRIGIQLLATWIRENSPLPEA